RDELATPIDRRWRRDTPGGRWPFRRASDNPASAAPSRDPGPNWDPDALYSWSSTTGDPVHAPAGTPIGAEIPPWSVLGLTSDASWDEVVRAHRGLAKQHHPDRHASDP